MPIVSHTEQDQVETRDPAGFGEALAQQSLVGGGRLPGDSAAVSQGWTLAGGIGTRSRKPRLASPALLSGDPSGTQRSSPQKTWTRSQGIRERYGSRARIVPICFGVLPPESATKACPRSATACSTARAKRSAAARASADPSGTTTTCPRGPKSRSSPHPRFLCTVRSGLLGAGHWRLAVLPRSCRLAVLPSPVFRHRGLVPVNPPGPCRWRMPARLRRPRRGRNTRSSSPSRSASSGSGAKTVRTMFGTSGLSLVVEISSASSRSTVKNPALPPSAASRTSSRVEAASGLAVGRRVERHLALPAGGAGAQRRAPDIRIAAHRQQLARRAPVQAGTEPAGVEQRARESGPVIGELA